MIPLASLTARHENFASRAASIATASSRSARTQLNAANLTAIRGDKGRSDSIGLLVMPSIRRRRVVRIGREQVSGPTASTHTGVGVGQPCPTKLRRTQQNRPNVCRVNFASGSGRLTSWYAVKVRYVGCWGQLYLRCNSYIFLTEAWSETATGTRTRVSEVPTCHDVAAPKRDEPNGLLTSGRRAQIRCHHHATSQLEQHRQLRWNVHSTSAANHCYGREFSASH